MFKEIVDDAQRTPDIGRSQKLTMSTLCSGELKRGERERGESCEVLIKWCFIPFSTSFI